MLVMRLRRSTSYFNAMDDAVAFLSELGRPDLAALLRFSHFTFVGVEIWDAYVAPGVPRSREILPSKSLKADSSDKPTGGI